GALARFRVAEQAGAGDEQRALLVQNTQIDALDRTGGITVADHQAATLQAVQRRFPGGGADRVVDYRHHGAVGEFAHALDDVFTRVVDHGPGAVAPRLFGLGFGRGGADDLDAQ